MKFILLIIDEILNVNFRAITANQVLNSRCLGHLHVWPIHPDLPGLSPAALPGLLAGLPHPSGGEPGLPPQEPAGGQAAGGHQAPLRQGPGDRRGELP